MSKKLLPNRSSKVVVPDAPTKIRQAIALLDEVLGDNTPISEEDYKALRKIADKLKQETDDVFAIAKENDDFLDDTMTVEEMEKDKRYYELCDLMRSMLKAFLIKLDREQNIAGAEYYNACSLYEENIGIKVGRGNAKAQNVQAQLDAINRNRSGGGGTKKADTTTTK